jgi:hypothetical protein
VSLEKIVKENRIILMVFEREEYSHSIAKIIPLLTRKSKKVCYVTLNKPSSIIMKEFKKKKINPGKFVFIDAVSSERGYNIITVPSPKALSEINNAIRGVMAKNLSTSIIFDSLSTIAFYENPSTLKKFVKSIVTDIRTRDATVVFTMLERDMTPEISSSLNKMMDKVIGREERGLKTRSKKMYSAMNKELVQLIEQLFGPDTSKVILEHSKRKDPKAFLSEWTQMMAKIVGPENAQKQLRAIMMKYMGGSI